jgi:hypothetical protein
MKNFKFKIKNDISTTGGNSANINLIPYLKIYTNQGINQELMETKFQILPAINIILECGLLFWEASITYTKTLKSKKFLNNSNE